MKDNSSKIEFIISYKFKNQNILKEALHHPSIKTTLNNYERLEFLGDSILGAVVSEWLFKRELNIDQGQLSKKKSLLINKKKISIISEKLGLIEYAKIDASVNLNIESTRQKISSDLYESIIGAIFLDSNYENTKVFIKNSLLSQIQISIEDLNNKGNLNEFCSIKNFNQPKYTIIKDSGPAHRKEYKVLLVVDSMSFFGEGYKIKDAENMAALKALKYFNFFS